MLNHKTSPSKVTKIRNLIKHLLQAQHCEIGISHKTVKLLFICIINPSKKQNKTPNTWMLSSILHNNQWIIGTIKERIKIYLETNENENIMIQNLWDTAKAVLRGNFTEILAKLRKQVNSQINILHLHVNDVEKE